MSKMTMSGMPCFVDRAVIVTGSRDIGGDPSWERVIERVVKELRFLDSPILARERVKVIHGDCRGADRMAARIADRQGMQVHPFPYPNGMGKSGGPFRNRQMLRELIGLRDNCGADIHVIAFHPDIKASKGTKDMIAAAKSAGVDVRLFQEGDDPA
jgi:hypothetical protein